MLESTSAAFGDVAETTIKVGEIVGEIAAASNEQTQGFEQIRKAVSEMDKVTQNTAANSEESASAAEELNAQAEQMRQIVEELKTLVGGSSLERRPRKGSAYHAKTQNVGGSGRSPCLRDGLISAGALFPAGKSEEGKFW